MKPAIKPRGPHKDKAKLKGAMFDLVAKSKGTMIAPREVIQSIEMMSPQAVETLRELMLTSKADSVRLKAALEVLALAGISKETKISIKGEVADLNVNEIDDRLKDLLGQAAHTVIDSKAIDITPEEEDDIEDQEEA